MTLKSGLHILSLEEYLADPCEAPSLNASLAQILLTRSPMHAYLAHPHLNPGLVRETSDAFDLGTAVHELVLEGADRICAIPSKDWKTKDAQKLRAAARKAGLIPLLTAQMEKARAMADAIQVQVEDFPDPVPLRNGVSERVVIWQEGAIWCRARLDYLHADMKVVDDLKTTGESAHPAEWSRRLFDRGHDLQVAFHTRAIQKVFGELPEFRFLSVETEPPYALSLIGLDPEALDFAQVRMRRAIELWARCLRTGRFPGYPTRPVYASVPPWILTRWSESLYYEEASHDPG